MQRLFYEKSYTIKGKWLRFAFWGCGSLMNALEP
ncbi:hypothetical protein Mpal_1425 [Methanosphaerula palustris E1-9c]|uniref:Uncharacterized protein n=1 Tax=Methanosphaerula palustris (strain ATCC BAA-1556 / DSM 19958 / E1-9c) TaxID=521011 RepID=B8GI12_METPE|nr:hypothetical protein Mpal_1425 [Methanosphaerula palustris E1-9c]